MLRFPLPTSNEGKLALASTLLCLILLVRLARVQTRLDAKPETMDGSVDHRTEDVRRGPVKITTERVVSPDGTKTTKRVREEGVVETKKTFVLESTHKEVPWSDAEAPRTRYLGFGVNPLDYTRQWRGRGGLTIFGSIDAGVAIDVNPVLLKLDRPMLELAYRF